MPLIAASVPKTLTIRNVPDSLARKLKTRAQRNHRSLQGEVMAILEQASAANTAEHPSARYRENVKGSAGEEKVRATMPQRAAGSAESKLTIEEIWERGKRLGLSSPNESARIIRKLRDERYGR